MTPSVGLWPPGTQACEPACRGAHRYEQVCISHGTTHFMHTKWIKAARIIQEGIVGPVALFRVFKGFLSSYLFLLNTKHAEDNLSLWDSELPCPTDSLFVSPAVITSDFFCPAFCGCWVQGAWVLVQVLPRWGHNKVLRERCCPSSLVTTRLAC